MPPDSDAFLCEDWGLCTRVRHHPQKIVLFLAAMRHFASSLRQRGRRVHYHRLAPRGPTLWRRLEQTWRAGGYGQLLAYRPHDRIFAAELIQFAQQGGIPLTLIESPGFLTTPALWQAYRSRGGRPFMARFYEFQRRRLGILVDLDGQPTGGRWSFDTENRRRIPAGVSPPCPPHFAPDVETKAVMELVTEAFDAHPGEVESFGWPVTRTQACQALDSFLWQRMDHFGPYEDAISRHEPFLWHSLLSPALNLGLLTPDEVIRGAVQAYEVGSARIESTEALVRQVLGWREFVRGIDLDYGENGLDRANALGHQRRLGAAWWNGTTGLLPLDTVIHRVRRYGWCHHIERLMVVGAAMLMCEVHPDEAYRWFMEMFVDSADWVMAANVYGMSQFADGGYFATKPYLSGSAYLRRMSDFPAGEWCDVWDGLYWRFVDRHRELLGRNPRTSFLPRAYDRLDTQGRNRKIELARQFLEHTTHLDMCLVS